MAGTPTWERTGQITLTNGSDIVTGTGTAFVTNGVTHSEILVCIANGTMQLLEVAQVDTDTQLRILPSWSNPTEGPIDYYIIANITGTHNYEIAYKIDSLLTIRSITQKEMVTWANGDLIGVPVNNFLVNGNFDTGDTTGWTLETTDPLTTYDASSDRLEIKRNGGSVEPHIEQTVSVVNGQTYAIVMDVAYGSINQWQVTVDGLEVIATEDVVLGRRTANFVASGTTATLRITSKSDSGSILYIDNIELGDPSNGDYPFLDADSGEYIWVPCPLKVNRDNYQIWLDEGNVGTEQDFLNDIKGETGDPSTIAIGSVSSVPFNLGNDTAVVNSGTAIDAVLDFTLERGEAATLDLGTVSTGAPGSNVIINNSGDTSAAIFDFTIPRGDMGVGLPVGGAAGEVLKKVSGTDFDYTWELPGGVTDWSNVGNTPTTLSGYGITDAYTSAYIDANFLSSAQTWLEADITDLDKYTQAQVDALLVGKADSFHTHSEAEILDLDRYTRAEVDAKLSGAGATRAKINQVAHGFSVLDCIHFDGNNWIKAQADSVDTTAMGVVVSVDDADNFDYSMSGRYDVGVHGLVVGDWYYLSDAVAGELSFSRPNNIEQPIVFVETLTVIIIYAYRPSDLSYTQGAGAGTGSGGSTESDVTQSAHGFSVLECVRHDGANWVLAQADDADTVANAVVVKVLDSNQFRISITGRYNMPGHGLTPANWYFLSQATPGGLDIVSPNISQPILFVEDTANVVIYSYRASSPPLTLNVIEATRPAVVTENGTSYTISSSDEQRVILFDNASAITVTVPENAADAIPTGFMVHLHQEGEGVLTVAASGAAVVNSSGSLTSAGRYAALSLMKIGTDNWKLVGDQQ